MPAGIVVAGGCAVGGAAVGCAATEPAVRAVLRTIAIATECFMILNL